MALSCIWGLKNAFVTTNLRHIIDKFISREYHFKLYFAEIRNYFEVYFKIIKIPPDGQRMLALRGYI